MSFPEQGLIIIANNSVDEHGQVIDYIASANIAAYGAKRYLNNIHATLLTSDVNASAKDFDEVIHIPDRATSHRGMVSGTQTITYQWDNDHRIDAFDYTPYKKTLMIDADYFIMHDNLNMHMNWHQVSFLTGTHCYDGTFRNTYDNARYLGDQAIAQVWATVMMWTEEAKPIFEAAKMVRDNYEMYALLTNTPVRPFRNDVAFSIACHMLNVKLPGYGLYNVPPDTEIVARSEGNYLILNRPIPQSTELQRWAGVDMHLLNKKFMLREDGAGMRELLRAYYDHDT